MRLKKDIESIEIQAIEKYDICIFESPLVVNGKSYSGAMREREVIVRDRIDAERWSKEALGFFCTDGVIAALASATMKFGTIEGSLEPDKNGLLTEALTVSNVDVLAADMIVDSMSYENFTMVSLLMGKPHRSQLLKSETLLKSSDSQPTAGSQ